VEKHLKKFFYTCVAVPLLFSSAAINTSQALVLPPADDGVTSLPFGDFDVYSLALLNVLSGNGAPQPGEPYYVASSPGAIKDDVVFGTGASGGPLNDNPAGMDDAYTTPSGTDTADLSFSTQTVPDPSDGPGGGLTDLTTTWDAETEALRDFLGPDGQFIPFFNLNDTGTDGLDGIDLLIWAEFTLSGNAVADQVFTLSGTESEGGFDDWAYVHGTICASTTQFYHLGPCDLNSPFDGMDVNQNLGANNAAFAIYNAQLDAFIKNANSGYDLLRIDWRMAKLNNGYEQAFLNATTSISIVSEPAALMLFGFGLVGLGFFRRKRR